MRLILLLAGAVTFWPASVSAQSTLAQDAEAFGLRESVSSIDLSPDGRKVVYTEPTGATGSIAYIGDVLSGTATPFLKSSGNPDEKLRWCNFVADTRLICRYTGLTKVEGLIVPFARLVAMNTDGSEMKQLGQSSGFEDERLRQWDGTIIDWLPGAGGSVLMQREYVPDGTQTGSRLRRSKDGSGVDRLDTSTLAYQAVEKPRKGVSDYMTDGRGNVRLMVVQEQGASGVLSGRERIEYRPAGSREWKPLTAFDADGIKPLAIDAGSDSLYALKKLNGRQALYRIKLADPATTELVAANPSVDIDDVIRSAHGQRVIGYTYAEDRRQTVYTDPDYKALSDSLRKALPGLPLVQFAGASQDGSKLLLFAGSDGDSGRYYVFDRGAKKLNELFLVRPQLEKRRMAAVKPIEVKVADGTVVPAYLTLPLGKEARGLPAVVLPHGGPSSRDEWGFDWLAQFLAARGYAVLQPNYRGSAGFGDQWLAENGFKSWRTSVGDVAGSIRWLVSEGIADPNRLAAVGWSYGGYAALQAAATEPSLFKAVVAIAPVTDLGLLKSEADAYSTRDLVAQFVGSGPHVTEGSPLRRASSIKSPVLLAHGDMDLNVGIQHSLKMDAALRSSGTAVELLRYKGLDHQLEDSSARRELLIKIGQLLERTIGR